jgi:alpha-mannosidase
MTKLKTTEKNFSPIQRSLLLALLFGVLVSSFLVVGLFSQEQKKDQLRVNPRELTASLIGHAQIDLSWLWLWEETVHEVAPMTFRGTLRQMDRLPGLTFAQSQAAIYEAMEKNYPDLFQQIKSKVKGGTWIPVGGMWVEPDLNMPDGESLARQLLYGEGDHGGGPRDSDVEAILKFPNDPNHPKFEFVNPENYFRKIENLNIDYPEVKKELNFAFPGCSTAQVETKKFNRRLENLLLQAEKFSSLARIIGARDYYPDRDIDEAWNIVLRNQFHDILDGSAIGPVYKQVKTYYQEAEKRGRRVLDFSLETIANLIDTPGEGWPLVVFNSLPWKRTEPVETELVFSHPVKAVKILDSSGTEIPSQILSLEEEKGQKFGEKEEAGQWKVRVLFVAQAMPSFGYKTFRVVKARSEGEYKTPVSVSKKVLENEFVKLKLDPETGWWKSLIDKKSGQEFLAGAGKCGGHSA